MSEEWVGCRVSLDCAGLGFFQGVICRINMGEQTVTLEKPFQNGLACKFPEITLNASDIQDLKILKTKEEIQNESTEATTGSSVVQLVKKKPKQPVAEHLKGGGNTTSSNRDNKNVSKAGKAQPLMSAPVPAHIVNSVNRSSPRFCNARASPKGGGYDQGGFRNRTFSEGGVRTPTRGERLRQKDEDCFGQMGDALDEEELREDFDFEKNLAMFDKDMVMREIDAELANKPDIVRLVHCNRRQPEPKYRNDENVLAGVTAEYRQITTGEGDCGEFVTDLGLVVPCVSLALRERLQAVIVNHGLGVERQAEVMGRAATELAIQLLGGQHRLTPTNMHQVPTAVFLCGPSQVATFGISAARHLASHGVKTQVFLPDAAHYPHILETELRLYRLTGGKVVTKGKDLPKGSVDLIVTAMEDQEMWSQERCQPWHRNATAWAESCKAPVLAIDPPPHPPALEVKMTLVGGLPLRHPQEAGKLYLANLGIPKNIYKEVGIKFSSPFGAKFVIPLHTSCTS